MSSDKALVPHDPARDEALQQSIRLMLRLLAARLPQSPARDWRMTYVMRRAELAST